MSCPLAIFLDEPTSGLDSTSALTVCETLKAIASLGVTVVTVIHQPRYEVFEQFDDLLLLAPGGRTVYLGPQSEVIPYFENLGFHTKKNQNPADLMMDALSGTMDPRGTIEFFTGSWLKHIEGKKTDPLTDVTDTRVLKSLERGAPFWQQIHFCHTRSVIQ